MPDQMTLDDIDDTAGWTSPPEGPTHREAVQTFVRGVVAVQEEMGADQVPGFLDHARELLRLVRAMTPEQSERATQHMQALWNESPGYGRSRILLDAAHAAVQSPHADAG